MTTADFRTEAWDAYQAGQWAIAADLYQKAIDVYPVKKSALVELDLKNLATRRDTCRSLAG